MAHVTKSELQKLIEAYGMMYGSSRGASFKIQERYSRKFYSLYNKIQDKYGQSIAQHDFDRLAQAGKSWWDSRIVKGPSVDW